MSEFETNVKKLFDDICLVMKKECREEYYAKHINFTYDGKPNTKEKLEILLEKVFEMLIELSDEAVKKNSEIVPIQEIALILYAYNTKKLKILIFCMKSSLVKDICVQVSSFFECSDCSCHEGIVHTLESNISELTSSLGWDHNNTDYVAYINELDSYLKRFYDQKIFIENEACISDINRERVTLTFRVFENKTLTLDKCKIKKISILDIVEDKNATIYFKNCELGDVFVLDNMNLVFDNCKIDKLYYQSTECSTLEIKNSKLYEFSMSTSVIDSFCVIHSHIGKFRLHHSTINKLDVTGNLLGDSRYISH